MEKEDLAIAIRQALENETDIMERRMFGGICFMKRRHMLGGASGTGQLLLRVGKERYEEVLAHPAASPMNFTGRPMRGYVYVDIASAANTKPLREWLAMALSFVAMLPDKP